MLGPPVPQAVTTMPNQSGSVMLCCPAGQVLGLNPRLYDVDLIVDPSRVSTCLPGSPGTY